MTKKRSKTRAVDRWIELNESLSQRAPHLMAWCQDADEFAELRIKAQDDGTTLCIAKGFGSDGGPVVCFGGGYGISAAILAIDATIAANRWREDKPWSGN